MNEVPAYKLDQTILLVRVSGQATGGVRHPPDIPVDGNIVWIETVLHVTEELLLRLHKSDSSKTMSFAQSPRSHPSEAFSLLVVYP